MYKNSLLWQIVAFKQVVSYVTELYKRFAQVCHIHTWKRSRESCRQHEKSNRADQLNVNFKAEISPILSDATWGIF